MSRKSRRTWKHKASYKQTKSWLRNNEAEARASTEKNENREGHVYAIYLGMQSQVKIGRTKNLQKRIQALRASNPNIRFLWSAWVKDCCDVENRLHAIFKKQKIEREVFSLHPNDIKRIDQLVNQIKESY